MSPITLDREETMTKLYTDPLIESITCESTNLSSKEVEIAIQEIRQNARFQPGYKGNTTNLQRAFVWTFSRKKHYYWANIAKQMDKIRANG